MNVDDAKYDPCRLFRKGDQVRVVVYKGRCGKPYGLLVGAVLTVSQDESNSDTFVVSCDKGGKDFYFDPAYLELVTPVEELEPFYLEETTGTITLLSRIDPIFLKCWHYGSVRTGVQAFAKAEAERDRLNAEYRKEMEK